MAKNSMITLLPRYNANRMVDEYAKKFYQPASNQGALYAKNECDGAKKVAAWKAKVRDVWHDVALHRLDEPCESTNFGEPLHFKVALKLNGLKPEDVVVELLLYSHFKQTKLRNFKFVYTGNGPSGEYLFDLEITPKLCGKQEYFISTYPYHNLLTHPMEMGMMAWL